MSVVDVGVPSSKVIATTSPVRRPIQQVTRFPHPMMWLARALAGNGRYSVQPFPKAAQER